MCKEIFENYVKELKADPKNFWCKNKTPDFWEDCYNKIKASGLEFNPKHITINTNGVSYDYVAYKNKMLMAYPESEIDVALVYVGDDFSFANNGGKITYYHKSANPFKHEDKDIIGGFCVIKNKRGEFLTTLSKNEIEKARKVAKTQAIWQNWYAEMCLKTVIKKAVKFHFDDIYTSMEEEDNKQYDLEKVLNDAQEFPIALINAINEAKSVQALTAIYKREYNALETPELKAEFVSRCSTRKQEIQGAMQ